PSSFPDSQAGHKGLYAQMGYQEWQHDYPGIDWPSMYETAKREHTRHLNVLRAQTHRNVIAYGALAALSLILLATHLLWARRVGVLRRRLPGAPAFRVAAFCD